MKIHEYQAKEILKRYGITTLNGYVCSTLDEIKIASYKIKYPCMIKAQIHAGGRGLGGGIKIIKNNKDAVTLGKAILGMNLVTTQTGILGKKVQKVLIEEACNIKKELYVGLVLDRDQNKVCLIASTEGGVEIEKTAMSKPSKILKEWINPVFGLMQFQSRNLVSKLGINIKLRKQLMLFFHNLYKAYIASDATLIEINPCVITEQNNIFALDAKLDIDNNALFRQKLLLSMYDPNQDDYREVIAAKSNLNYVALKGNIGCIVNGAGLAMSTMDVIKHVGGSPANFLDVGGSTTKERVAKAIEIILYDTNIKSIFINVFGGIVKCDIIADGIVLASKKLNINIPIIVRLEGTNDKLGNNILKNSKLKIAFVDNMLDGAKKVVVAARI